MKRIGPIVRSLWTNRATILVPSHHGLQSFYVDHHHEQWAAIASAILLYDFWSSRTKPVDIAEWFQVKSTAAVIVNVNKIHRHCVIHSQFAVRRIYSVFLGLVVDTNHLCSIHFRDISSGHVFLRHLHLHSNNGRWCCGNIGWAR